MDLFGFFDASDMLKAGVYALVYRGEVVYIGKSKSMLGRVYTHRQVWRSRKGGKVPSWLPVKGILFDEVHIRPCRLEQLDTLEAEMIKLYKPRGNVQLNTDRKSVV